MPPEAIRELLQLGASVVVTGMFVWYLSRRDSSMQTSLSDLSAAIHQLLGERNGKAKEDQQR